MRFSIRHLLALVVVAALAMVAWRSHQELLLQRARMTKLDTAITTVSQSLWLADPALHQALMSALDEYKAIGQLREQSEAALQSLREKYGGIEPRGPEVVSIRGLPTIRGDVGKAPLAFRLLIPPQRQVWFKYGVHQTKRNTQSGRAPDTEQGLLRESPFQHSGPYEMQVAPGDYVLTVAIGAAEGGLLPFKISLGDQVLVDSAFDHKPVSGSGWSSIAGGQQIDFPKKRTLPSLMSANMTLRDEAGQRLPTSFGFSIWLSPKTSGFEAFPENE